MNELKNRLRRELEQDLQVKINKTSVWNLPVQTLTVDYATVQQTKMDVLMKMLLNTFKAANFQSVDELSGILLVEPLFIRHIVEKMVYAGLVEQVASIYKLTSKGLEQLETEIFIDQYEEKTAELLYSPCHDQLSHQNLEEEANDELEDYRFYDQYSDWSLAGLNQKQAQALLQHMQPDEENKNVQTIVEKVESIKRLAVEVIPCIEFQLYNKEKDIFYARVWHTVFEEWDEVLEGQINQRDGKKWREQYKKINT